MNIEQGTLLFAVLGAASAAAPVLAAPTLATLVNFNGSNGSMPVCQLISDSAGNLYGTTEEGGPPFAYGTVFEVSGGTNVLSTLATFNNMNHYPAAGLISDAAGNLYGTTSAGLGDTIQSGGVFEVAAGTHALSNLANFLGYNGGAPYDSLIFDNEGNLYGTTSTPGTVFEITAATGVLTTLASFNALGNGQLPMSRLLEDNAGNLYGTTLEGGSGNFGTIFELAAGTHTITTLASFNGTDGSRPYAGLIRDAAGDLFGTASAWSANNGYGTVFELPGGSNSITALVTFNGTNGEYPGGDLICDAAGNLFSTTAGSYFNGSNGTIFEVTAETHSLITLFSFNGTDGQSPEAGLLADAEGDLYGTTSYGGINNDGTVFELSNSGFVTGVPEPGGLMLLGSAGMGLLARRRRKAR